jgi:glycerate kinase
LQEAILQTEKKVSDGRQPIILIAAAAACLEAGIKMLQELGYKVLDAKDLVFQSNHHGDRLAQTGLSV